MFNERRKVIRNRGEYWVRRLNVRPRHIRVQHNPESTSGIITLAIDLADREVFQDFDAHVASASPTTEDYLRH